MLQDTVRINLQGRKEDTEISFTPEEWRPLTTLMIEHCPWPKELNRRTVNEICSGVCEGYSEQDECEWVADALELAIHKIEPRRAEKEDVEIFSHPVLRNGETLECKIHITKLNEFISFLRECNGFKLNM